MTLHRPALRRIALSAFMLAIPLDAAFAQDATAVGERLKAVLTTQGIDLAYTAITGDASSMTLEGATVAIPGQPGQVALGNVTLTDITDDNGGYRIGGLTMPSYSVTEDGATVDISGIAIAGLKLPAEGSTDPISSVMLYETADLANLSVKIADKQVFSLDQMHFEITAPEDGKPMEFTGAAEKFSADLSTVEDAESRKVIDALGYQTINGFFELSGSWQPTDGRMTLSQYDISVDKAGTLGLTFDLGGYTPDFIKAMQEMQKEMAKAPEGGDNSAQGLAMLGLLQQLTFHSTSIRFDDDSLTNKVLEYVAAQQGAKPADLANQAKAILPLLMGQLGNAELTAQVTEAVSKYLDDPQSLEISAEPEAPVPFALIMAGAMSPSPQDLIKTLAVSVTANE